MTIEAKLDELKELIVRKHDLEDDKKAMTSGYNTRIKKLDEEIYALAKTHNSDQGELPLEEAKEVEKATDADFTVIDEDHQLESANAAVCPECDCDMEIVRDEEEPHAILFYCCRNCGREIENPNDVTGLLVESEFFAEGRTAADNGDLRYSNPYIGKDPEDVEEGDPEKAEAWDTGWLSVQAVLDEPDEPGEIQDVEEDEVSA